MAEEKTKSKGERKSKAKEPDKSAEEKKAIFPAKGMVNAYGFVHLSNGIAEEFGAPKGKKTPITIDFKDGSLIITKA